MRGVLKNAWGYQGDAMNLPVADVESSSAYYQKIMGFRVESQGAEPHRSVTLERDGIRMRLAENGGDPTQDGCAFQVENVEALFREFEANGWEPPVKPEGSFDTEIRNDGSKWRVFFVVAPDSLCYWFGEKLG
jgi:lactoylglutathione lyase